MRHGLVRLLATLTRHRSTTVALTWPRPYAHIPMYATQLYAYTASTVLCLRRLICVEAMWYSH